MCWIFHETLPIWLRYAVHLWPMKSLIKDWWPCFDLRFGKHKRAFSLVEKCRVTSWPNPYSSPAKNVWLVEARPRDIAKYTSIVCWTIFELFLSYFEKIAHMSVVWAYVSLWLCIFVALYVGMFVARTNKVEGTMSWCLGTNEILASI